MSTILKNGSSKFGFPEPLPTLGNGLLDKQSRSFRVTARDRRGRFSVDDVQIEVVGKEGTTVFGPFKVTSPVNGTVWKRGEEQEIKWDVANTNLTPIKCENVKISLSIDGGKTFDIILSESTANDGSEAISIPASINITDEARIKMEAVGNIFFNISLVDFKITE